MGGIYLREYECLYIVHPQVADEQLEELTGRFQSVLSDNGAELLSANPWGKRRLAYEIDRVREGIYIQLRFNSEPTAVDELDRALKFSEHVIRHLVVRAEDLDPAATNLVPEELPERGPEDFEDRRPRGRREAPQRTESPDEDAEASAGQETSAAEKESAPAAGIEAASEDAASTGEEQAAAVAEDAVTEAAVTEDAVAEEAPEPVDSAEPEVDQPAASEEPESEAEQSEG